ncbi:hypothetical protein R3P38DRAFT_3284469 [Favolaschia claudopus]|uniref:Uncharacterized protein n=1 Tax=Favolaschia claudopus TaxID=2862362 RepID=A0AAW0A5T0_9AGAR
MLRTTTDLPCLPPTTTTTLTLVVAVRATTSPRRRRRRRRRRRYRCSSVSPSLFQLESATKDSRRHSAPEGIVLAPAPAIPTTCSHPPSPSPFVSTPPSDLCRKISRVRYKFSATLRRMLSLHSPPPSPLV